MSKSLSSVLDRVEGYLEGPYHREFAVLGVGCSDTDATVTPDDEPLTLAIEAVIRRGDVINVDTETMLVRAWDPVASQASVFRGWVGTTAAAHALGARVDVAPRTPRGVLWGDLLDEIAGLPQGIFRVVRQQVTVASDTMGERVIALPVAMAVNYGVRVLRASHMDGEWGRFARLSHRYEVTSSGPVLILEDYRYDEDLLDLEARCPFDVSAATLTTTLADLGLGESMADVVAMGAALRRLGWLESQRSDRQVQGEPRVAAESPPMHIVQTMERLRLVYDRRLANEAVRLVAYHGWSI